MSSAICFNLDQSKILSSGNGLMRKEIHPSSVSDLIFVMVRQNGLHASPQYIYPLPHNADFLRRFKGKPFENIVGKEENAGNQHFLLFPHCFPPLPNQI